VEKRLFGVLLSDSSSLIFRQKCAGVKPALADIQRFISAFFTSEVEILNFEG